MKSKISSVTSEGFFLGLSAMAALIGLIAIPVYWSFLFFIFLKYGNLMPAPGIFATELLGVHVHWLTNPRSWFGLHRLIVVFLNLFGPGFFVMASGFLGIVGILSDRKARRERLAGLKTNSDLDAK